MGGHPRLIDTLFHKVTEDPAILFLPCECFLFQGYLWLTLTADAVAFTFIFQAAEKMKGKKPNLPESLTHSLFPVTSYWPEFSHMATFSYEGVLEMYS